jgi:hypothetical protein
VPLKLKEIWAIRIRLQLPGLTRDLALFNLAIDSKRTVSHRESLIRELHSDPELVLQYVLAVAEDGNPKVLRAALNTVMGKVTGGFHHARARGLEFL